jgi:hypothetical protein
MRQVDPHRAHQTGDTTMAHTERFPHTLFRIESVEASACQHSADDLIAPLAEELGCVGPMCPVGSTPPAVQNRSPKPPTPATDRCRRTGFAGFLTREPRPVSTFARRRLLAHDFATTEPAATCRSVSSNSISTGHEWRGSTRFCRPTETFQVRDPAPNAPAAGVEHGLAKVLT